MLIPIEGKKFGKGSDREEGLVEAATQVLLQTARREF
jgi:hypothetical protein